MLNGRLDDVETADYVGLHRLHGEELARGDLFQSRRVENELDAIHRSVDAGPISDVTDDVPQSRVGQLTSHFVLLPLVAAEDAYFLTGTLEQMSHHRLAKRASTAGD